MLGRAALAIVAALVVVISPAPVLDSIGRASSAPAPSALAEGLVTDAVPLPAGSSVEPLLPGSAVRLAFTLPLSNSSRLASFLANVSDPSSPGYRDFLPYHEVVERYGPSKGEVASVEDALRAAGGTAISAVPGGFTVDATFAARDVDALLAVHLVGYDAPVQGPGYTTVGIPRVPAALAGEIVGIDGLAGAVPSAVDAANLNARSVPQPVPTELPQFVRGNGTAGADWFFGSDFAQAYEATELLPTGPSSVPGATYPSGIAIATLLGSGYNATNFTTLPPWSYAVVDRYFNDTFPAGWPLPTLTGVPVTEAGAPSPPPPGPFHGQGDSTDLVTENSLDLEMAGSLAPGAALYNFYVSGGLLYSPATSPNSPEYLTDDLAAALAYNYTPDHLAVVSCSFGIDDLNESGWDTQLELAAAMGVTVVASSGDQGDASSGLTGRVQNAWPLWPATAAFNTSGAVSVGGVTVALSGIPTGTYTTPPLVAAYDPNVEGGLANSTAWWDTTGGPGHFAGTEGGTSLVYPEPWWQFHSAAQWPIVNATEREGFGRLGRAGPDVAFPANSTVAYVADLAGGVPEFEVLGGTSVAAPVFAGLLADIVAVESTRAGRFAPLGFLDPVLYRMASYYQANPGSSDPFIPVDSGGNALFSAAAGWNPTTGWGGLYAPLFLAADADAAVVNFSYTGPTPGLPPASTSPVSLLTFVAILLVSAGVLIAAGVLLAGRRRATALAPGPFDPSFPPGSAPLGAPPPSGVVATFSCPYCGHERPAEPVRCPSCGAM